MKRKEEGQAPNHSPPRIIGGSGSGQAMVEYVLAVAFAGLAALGAHALFSAALEKYYSRLIGMLSSFTP